MTTTSKIKKPLKIAVLGATGIVGQEFVNILEERKLPVEELRLFASQNSAGSVVSFRGKSVKISEPKTGCFDGCDVAFFSAGADISKQWAAVAVKSGAYVVDNSSAFRMDKDVPLVVPEVNGALLKSLKKATIIANPNCSTIQLVVMLKPLQDAFTLKQVTVATYQSVSGAGREGVEELSRQTVAMLNAKTDVKPKVFAHNIAFTNLPHIDKFDESGFTYEEKKIMNETQKIMSLPKLNISATAVRTPTFNGHSEAVWVDLEKETTRVELISVLKKAPGIIIQDDTKLNAYPLNREASGQDEVFVGRIRQDIYNPRRWLFWVVSDNLRKGAALNGIQIAEELFTR